jgi:ribosome-associated toxin RatA of RatAB toxin-antitoxin module
MWLRWLTISGFVLSYALVAVADPEARADTGPEAEMNRVAHSRDVVGYTLAMPSASIKAGGAMLSVDAPMADVRQVITDYAHYQEIVPGFQKSRILARGPAGTDVYLQAPILHGAATLWAVVRFSLPVRDGTGERIEGKKTGPANVDDLRATWKLYPIDASHTLLKLEFLMVPSLPLPGAMVTPQLQEVSEDAVRACRTRAENIARLHADNSGADAGP